MRGKASGYLYNGFRCDVEDAILLATIKTNYGSVNRRGQGGDRKAPLSRPQARFPLQREKSRNMEVQCEGASGATAKPPTRLRRGEIPCLRKRPAMTGSHTIRSRPFGATQHSWSNEQLGGASEDAQSYWQGRFAACALLTCPLGLVGRGTVGALPQTPQGTLSLDPARGNCPLTPFRD